MGMLAKKIKRKERKVPFFLLLQHFCAFQSPFSFLFPTSLAHTTHVKHGRRGRKKGPTGGGLDEKRGWMRNGRRKKKKKSAANWL
jgi:hypothetical protein